MWKRILLYLKFTIKTKGDILIKAPCQNIDSWVLIDHKERSGCQGDWYEYLFYSKTSKHLFYAATDLYISGSGRSFPVTEFHVMDFDYKNNVYLKDWDNIAKIGSLI